MYEVTVVIRMLLISHTVIQLSGETKTEELQRVINDMREQMNGRNEQSLASFFEDIEVKYDYHPALFGGPDAVFGKDLVHAHLNSKSSMTEAELENVLHLGAPRSSVECWHAISNCVSGAESTSQSQTSPIRKYLFVKSNNL